ncbi:PHP domain-containing protein [Zoogloeaceae bacterium G21618-S1]|nr:PHP domain-containing protein [Zoogloeaceae bacterium G21618-S1]
MHAIPKNPDLHCHSTVSDGWLSPTDVVRRAAGNGVDFLALTDHDETGGLIEAQAAATEAGIRLVPGVEVSVSWGGETIHVVGLGVDVDNPVLQTGLTQLRAGRHTRAQQMSDALAALGIRGVLDGALTFARNPALVSRAHFARHLVAIGLMPNVDAVFKHYLVRGKPGFVETKWADLADAVQWIRTAGGVPVVAHPGRYRLSDIEMERLLARFVDAGGQGIEVVSGSHSDAKVSKFARYARRFDLLASRASDFHGEQESRVDLGRCAPLPDGVVPVWSRLIDRF